MKFWSDPRSHVPGQSFLLQMDFITYHDSYLCRSNTLKKFSAGKAFGSES